MRSVYPFISWINFFWIQSLEDVDNSKEVLTERESGKARKTPDTELNVAPDGDEDEVIEEDEEECWGMF